MAVPVQKVRRSRLSDQAAAELKRLIATGIYGGGSRLPAEPELAEQLGVTRLTVREALSQLEAAGFTQARHGSGTYVVDTAEIPTLGLLSELLGAGRKLAKEEYLGLMELRAVVVAGFVDAMVERAGPADLAELDRIVAEEKAVLGARPPRGEGRPRRLAELDYELNLVLARASQNFFYGLLIRSVRAVHVELGTIIFEQNQDDAAIVGTHEAIVAALKGRKVGSARKSVGAYLEGGSALVRAWARKEREDRPRLRSVRGRRPSARKGDEE